MKFVHIADVHFDRPFVNLSDKECWGDFRRLDQRKCFKKVIEYIKENEIPYLFIAGDLYEQNYVKKSTIEYINSLFQEIPNTKIFISPGNHDPFLKNSYYNQYQWNSNVFIFTSSFQKIELPDVDIYGYGFNDFYCTDCGIENLKIDNKEKLNICLLHATLNGASLEEKQYNSVSTNLLEDKGFDYIALGHIHKSNFEEKEQKNIIYPGSMVSLGFDELGAHGMIEGEIDKQNLSLKFIPLDEKEFIEHRIDVTDIYSKEELIEKIEATEFDSMNYVKIILIGKRNFEINTYEINKFITNPQVIKVRDKTKINYDLQKIQNDSTLRGLFAKEMLEKLSKENISQEEQEIIEKAIEIGFEALQ